MTKVAHISEGACFLAALNAGIRRAIKIATIAVTTSTSTM